MANKRGSGVQVGEFNPRGLVDVGNGAILRPDGSDAAANAKALGGLASEISDMADKAAKVEGRRDGAIAGNDPAWRPSGSSSIRGAAEDEAGLTAYTNNLDAKLRTSMTDIFQQHQNDPAALKGALDGLKASMSDPEKGDVFPEMAASFNASFERLRLPFQIKALDNFQGLQRDQARASAVVATSAGETMREQQIRGAPTAPATRQAVETTLAEDRQRDQQLVRSEALTAEQAAAREIKRRRDAEVTIVTATGEALPGTDAIASYRQQLRKDFSGNKTKLDADGYEAADAALAQLEQQRRSRGVQDKATVSGIFDKVVKQYSEGIPNSPDEIAAARQKAATLPGGDELVQDFDKRLLIASIVKTKAPAELDAMADEITAKARTDKRGLTTEEGARIEFLRGLSEKKRNALATDPLDLARRHGLVDAPPLVVPTDATAADKVAAQIGPRVAAGQAAASVQGGAVRYLTNDDKTMLKTVGDGGGDRALATVKGIVAGAGASAPAVLREIGGDMPELAKAGDLLVNGGPGSDGTARDIARALELRSVKDAKIPTLPKNAASLMREELGDAYLNSQTAQAQVMAGAKAIYEARAYGKITDPNSTEATELYREALNAAAGAGKQGADKYGGVANYRPGYVWNYKVAVPSNVRSDRFRDVVSAIRDDDLDGATDPNGRPITARDVRGAIPVRVRGGYAFSLDDPKDANPRFLGKPGAPLVLDIEGMAPRLRARVPGAYLGGDR